jgi:hypothetical protein
MEMKSLKILWVLVYSLFTLNAAYSSEAIKFELLDNRIFVDVFINHQGPFKFIFDTGGDNSMTPQLAAKLSLPFTDMGEATGAGNSSQKMGQTKVQSFKLGGIELQNQDFLVIDYSKIQSAFKFEALDGIFGYEFLSQYLTSIDYGKSRLEFFTDSKEFNSKDFDRINFQLLFNKPFIKTQLNGKTAHTLIDTGDRSALTVTKSFLKKTKFDRLFKEGPEVVSGYGIGGPIPARLGAFDRLKIRNFPLEHVVARAPTTAGGFNAIKGLDASLGNEVLKQFDIGFNYHDKIIYLKKNKNFGMPTKFHSF